MIDKDDEKILVIFLIYYTMNKSSLTYIERASFVSSKSPIIKKYPEWQSNA
jgi:hypothetical protein